jgi:hypothetical protein
MQHEKVGIYSKDRVGVGEWKITKRRHQREGNFCETHSTESLLKRGQGGGEVLLVI